MQLRIYAVSLEMVAEVADVANRVARRDGDLARQMRRASNSVPLNIAEGEHARGGTGPVRFGTALGSAKETLAALDVAVAARYIEATGVEQLRDRLDHLSAVLWKLSRR